jgi:hypothetical protein
MFKFENGEHIQTVAEAKEEERQMFKFENGEHIQTVAEAKEEERQMFKFENGEHIQTVAEAKEEERQMFKLQLLQMLIKPLPSPPQPTSSCRMINHLIR